MQALRISSILKRVLFFKKVDFFNFEFFFLKWRWGFDAPTDNGQQYVNCADISIE